MDEFGSIIDSSHLDSDDGAAADDNENFQSQESEITQTTLNIDDTKAESPSKPDDVMKELPVSAQEANGTSTEVDENEVAGDGDAAAGTHKETQETSLTQNEQGGSSSSAWLSSSVTGWLGLATEEGAGNLVEGVRKDEKKETQAKASFASSVTGWLGFGGEGEPDDAVKNSEGSPDSFTSTMTGWLGFGEEKKTDPSTETERDDEKENEKDQEPAETFRSRRMSLDLEGSQLHEEKEEMGTLGWLGNGLSNNLGFGTTKGEAEETIQEEEQPESSSWFDMGIGDILGFRGETSKDDERTGSSLKETGEDKPLEQFTGSENVDTSQSQPALTEEVSTETSNESEMKETPKDQNVSAETETEPGTTESVATDSDKNGLDTSDSSKDSVLSEDAAPEVDQKDISPQSDLKEESQAVDGMSSVLYSFFQTGSEEKAEDVLNDNEKETNVLDGEISAEMGDKDHLMPKSIEIVGEDNNPETAAEDIKDASGTDQGFLTESGINLAPDFGSADLNLNSTEHSVGKVEEDKTENEVKERDGITHHSDNTEESPDSLVKNDAGGDDHDGEGNSAETDVPQREIYASQTDDSAEHGPAHGGAEENGGESQLYLSSDMASTEDDMLTAYNEETDVDSLESLAIIGINSEAELHHAELGQEGHPVEGSSTEFGSSHNTEIISENETEDRGTFSTSESTIQMEDSPDQDPLSLHMPSDAHMPEEIVMKTEEDRENHLQPIHTETAEMEKHILSESGLRSAVESEKEIEQVEEMQGETEEKEVEAQEKKQGVKEEKLEEFKEEEKQEETEEVMNEGKQVVVEDTKKEEETQGREEEIKVEENVMALETQQEMEEEKQGKVEELEKKGIQEEIELKMEEKQEVEVVTKEGENQGEEEKLRREEDIMTPETQQEVEEEMQEKVEELKEEGTHEEIKALKEEEKQEAQEGAKEDESQREMKEEKLEEVESLKEDEEQQQIEELQEEKQDNVGDLTEDKRGEDLKEVEEENENERSVDDEKQVQLSLSELEMENTDKSESESDDKEMQHEPGLESVLSETPTLTENPLMEDQSTEEETKQTGKVEEEKDELKEEDVVEKQEMEDVKGERRDQEEEGELKCSNELCPQAGEDGFVRDSEENDSSNRLSSIDEGELETETQNPLVDNDHTLTDGTGVSQEVPSESTETDEGRKQEEEKRHDDAKAGEGEKENSESNLTGNEDIKSNNANSISDYNTLGVNQIKQSDCTDNDLLCLGESGQNDLPDHIILGQTAENKEDDQLSLKEAINADVSDDNTLLQGENTEPDNTEGNSKETEQIYSDHKKREETGEIMNEEKQVVEEDTKEEETQGREEEIKIEENVTALETQQEMEGEKQEKVEELEEKGIQEEIEELKREEKQEVEEMTERDTDREKRQINGKHDDVTLNEDVQMKINDDNTVSTEFRAEAGIEISVSSDGPDKSQVVTSEQVAPDVSQHATGSSLLSDDHNKGKAKTESGAFGLLKNAFRFFSETPDTESTGSASSLDSNIDETSVAQDPLTLEQESDLTADSTQVHVQGLHTESPITLSQQQQQPSPPPIPQTSSPSPTQNLSHPTSHSPNTVSPLQTKILSRHYKNLLSYMSVEDMTVLIELFGQNKLQFLDFILGSSESSTDDPDNDESILSDIERLLHYHKDTLVAPSKRLADSPQEEKEKTRMLIALQNFELLLAKVRETFNKAKSHSSNTIRQGIFVYMASKIMADISDTLFLYFSFSTGLTCSDLNHDACASLLQGMHLRPVKTRKFPQKGSQVKWDIPLKAWITTIQEMNGWGSIIKEMEKRESPLSPVLTFRQDHHSHRKVWMAPVSLNNEELKDD